MPAHPPILPNEKELFNRISKGDESAFAEVFYFYEPRIYPFVLKMTHSETIAEEVVQELFINLWLNRSSAADIQFPRSYIFKMAANKTANHLKSISRKLAREKNAALLLEDTQLNAAEDSIALREMQAAVAEAVDKLPAQQKLVFTLNRQQGLKNKEIAEKLNISEKTVKNHLTEALRSIREHLQKQPGTSITLLLLLSGIHPN